MQRVTNHGSSQPAHRPIAHWLLVLLGVGLLTYLESRLVYLVEYKSFKWQVQNARYVLAGTPAWLPYQSRLLGPLMVTGLVHITHLRFMLCYRIFCTAVLYTSNLLCYLLFSRLSRSDRVAWLYTFAYCAIFIAFLDKYDIYIWDYICLPTSLLFAYLIFTGARPISFVLLYAVALLNRESALYIGVWLFLDAWRSMPGESSNGPRFKFDMRQGSIGVGLILLCLAWVRIIRKLLFVRQALPLQKGMRIVGGQVLTLPINLHELAHPFGGRGVLLDFPIVLTICLGLCALLYRYHQVMSGSGSFLPRSVPLAILLALMAVNNLTFGLLGSIRIWLEMLPFGIFLFYMLYQKNLGQAALPPDKRSIETYERNGKAIGVTDSDTTSATLQ